MSGDLRLDMGNERALEMISFMRGGCAPGRSIALAILMVAAFGSSGCAIFGFSQGPTFQLVEKNLVPESEGAQLAMAPLLIPVGTVAALADIAIVHPIRSAREAGGDTREWIWEDLQWDEHYVVELSLLPWRSLATPVVFGVNTVARTLFWMPWVDYDNRGDQPAPETNVEAEELLRRARELFEQGKYSEAELLIRNEWAGPWYFRTDTEMRGKFVVLAMQSAWKLENPGQYLRWGRELLPNQLELYADDLQPMMEAVRTSEDPLWRVVAYETEYSVARDEGKDEVLAKALTDPDPNVRTFVLDFLPIASYATPDMKEPKRQLTANLRKALERIAQEDPSQLNRRHAQWLLERVHN